MSTNANQERILFGLGFLLLFIAIVSWVAVLFLIIQERRVTHYPGADIASDHTLYKFNPRPMIKRASSYTTQDKFPVVYKWYSNDLNLGTERQAQGGCIHLFSTNHWLFLIRSMSVTLCDAPAGRMIFAHHSLQLSN